MRNLIELMVADGELHELFNSQTGQGLGAVEQGWTAGIFLDLVKMARMEKAKGPP